MNARAAIRRRVPPAAGVLLVFAAVALAYLPVWRAGFVWDDDGHVTRPDLRSLHGLFRIWFEPGATQQYYPMLHSAFWLQHRIWGDTALGYHLADLVLHAGAACLLVWVLRRLSVPGAWLAGLLFALHPVNVESAAWISEQKNTLSAGFYFAAAAFYLSPSDRRRWPSYALATLCFVGALLSKSVTATLPEALLVVLWWRQSGFSWRRELRLLAPWVALGVAAGLFTAWMERHYVGAQGAPFALSWPQRLLIAGRAPWFYAGKLLWPHPLTFIYPRWVVAPADPRQWLYPAASLAVILLLAARRRRGALAAVLYFVGTLFPALGFFNVYPFVFSFVADHFQYLATAGLLSLTAAGWALGFGRSSRPGLWLAGAGAVLVLLGALSFRQALNYRDMETLYRATLRDNPESWLAHDNLGVVLAASGRADEAVEHYRAVLRLRPDYPEAYNNLGNLLARRGQWNDAIGQYRAALRVRPGFSAAEFDWGNALADQGRDSEARQHYLRALQLKPDYPEAEYRLGNTLANSGHLADAVEHYQRALILRPAYGEAEANLGLAYASAGRTAEGVAHLRSAIRLEPRNAAAHAYLGYALAQSGQSAAAVSEYRESLRLHDDNATAHFQLGVVLRSLGQTAAAAAEFQAAQRLERSGR